MRLGKANESDREGDGGEREKDKRKGDGKRERGSEAEIFITCKNDLQHGPQDDWKIAMTFQILRT
jgi:hypothetical protein